MTRIHAEGHPHTHAYARRALAHVAARSAGEAIDPALRVTLNFHPHFLGRLADDGVYRSQFVTGTSNGGLTAHPGGDRWRWESRIFGGAYDEAPADARPVYGALDFRRRPFGAAPRFGSAHLRLTPAALERATFCYPDSCLEPTDFGVAARMDLIALAEADDQDLLDDCIEAHIHGPVQVARDVEALVLDPSHRGTEVEAAARRLPCPVEWHGGFRLSVDELRRHPGFRGQEYVELGARIAVDGRLDPRIVQEAAGSGRYDPQDVKKVWHYLARFGAPAA
ncbi:DUF3626 domain-containing protein [Streptomyces sp. NPDC006553]|uniref:DUF3626 domain-containing protein n=1 Tax=unclassified Streptomyces TaxID=2593676 RepID=UPI002250540E|nr:DUF3626 domain-containing protein [Streptomyces sp. NBC_00233]MCX5231769.1 DUF3626 domain-containing protein [Streptomyces sp. NBC_00233]